MKDWSDLEERYQVMRQKDPHAAEEFKHRMTSRFQQTVQALEEEEAAEKHQLVAMHQQRINAHINQRKKDAMNCYTRALNDDPPNVSLNIDFRRMISYTVCLTFYNANTRVCQSSHPE